MRNRGWSTLEYCWRFGVRPLMWMVRLALVAWAIGCLSWLIAQGTHEGVIAAIAIYGIWEIGRSIRSVTHMTVNIAKGDKLIVQRGANVSVPKQDLDRVIEAIGRQEASRRE